MSKILMLGLFPTEILHYIFEYLSAYDILYAFDGLNRRIDAVLHNYDKYDFICQSISPEQIRSFTLSDAEDTVRQINFFFRSFYIRRLVNLKSLTLNEIGKQDWNKLASKLHYLTNLTSLSLISSCPLSYPPSDEKLSLKSLT
ncbi:hypothetical protein I4U23_006479 [Adineta vaga]|nr:hypothetical protein I4U23_006479 [Adineta vaga]